MSVIYIEKSVFDHPRTQAYIARYPKAAIRLCDQYQEVFNPKSQNYRLQKQKPSWIIAQKHGERLWPTPENFGFENYNNFYFSHLLNCPYDCRYCFLQGLYPSANHVWFINYEDIAKDIENKISDTDGRCAFFSGYDADSLACEPITGFLDFFLDFFAKHPEATLECRSKSAQIKALMQRDALNNVVLAFSLTPQHISKQIEHRVPDLTKRLSAMQQLANHGWPIGLRFDPLIDGKNFKRDYQELIEQVAKAVPAQLIHSISIGPLRFPKAMYQKILSHYPSDVLLNQAFEKRGKIISYSSEREQEMSYFVTKTLQKHFSTTQVINCVNEDLK